jgi:quercetin dioxygenase-like cupin family protein
VTDTLTPTLVRRADRRTATGLPAGSYGEEAFADPHAWVGFLKLPPGATSGWHHHGEWDSYACVLRGTLRWEYGPGGRDALEVSAGDTGRMPAHVVHRDVSAGDEDLEMILFRAGEGELTINVEGPDGG